MPKVKLNDLSGLALNYAVAITQGWEFERPQDGQMIKKHETLGARALLSDELDYSGSWAACGPLIDKYHASIEKRPCSVCSYQAIATLNGSGGKAEGIGAREAICRAVVGLHLGDTVDIPEELLTDG